MRLEKGFTVTSKFGATIKILDIFGEGGQGIVYKVLYKDEIKALKMYKISSLGSNPQAFYENIKNNILKGSPSPMYLWPLDMVDWQKDGSFGYVMDVRPQGYYELGKFLSSQVSFSSFGVMIDGLLNLIHAFRLLHIKGMSYQDLNDGNFFFNPKNGNLKICDTDNVAPNGFNTGVIGKPRYIAPEIIQGKALPSTSTDQYSLACILFMTLTNQHPLEGKRFLANYLNPLCEEVLYGYDPIFIMDPNNQKNGPVEEVHKNVLYMWKELPTYIKDAFTEQFSHEVLIENTNKRYTERNWLDLFIRLRSHIVHCYQCGGDTFLENQSSPICEDCSRQFSIGSSFILSGCDYEFPIAVGNIVYRMQLGACNVLNSLDKVLLIVPGSEGRNILGARNLTKETFEFFMPGKKVVLVYPGKVFPIINGCKVKLLNESISIRGFKNGKY